MRPCLTHAVKQIDGQRNVYKSVCIIIHDIVVRVNFLSSAAVERSGMMPNPLHFLAPPDRHQSPHSPHLHGDEAPPPGPAFCPLLLQLSPVAPPPPPPCPASALLTLPPAVFSPHTPVEEPRYDKLRRGKANSV